MAKKEVHPLPRLDETLDMLGGVKWFSTLDLTSGYWQVEMEPEHKEKTDFGTFWDLAVQSYTIRAF